MKTLIRLLSISFLAASTTIAASQTPSQQPAPAQTPPPPSAALLVHAIDYRGTLSESKATFSVTLDIELAGGTEGVLPLFEGELAVLTTKLPDHLQLSRDGNRYTLTCLKSGRHKFTLDLVAKINRKEPWNTVSFNGPQAAIGSVHLTAAGVNTDLQLLTGTVTETKQEHEFSEVRGFLGPDRVVSTRWQSRAAEVTRKALLTCETASTFQITPTVIKYNTVFRYDIVQGTAPKLTLSLPLTQALTRVQGDQIRDWRLEPAGDNQVLTVEFIKPVEKSYQLALFTEQPVTLTGEAITLAPPAPLDVQRESGSLTIMAEDVLVETDTMTALRQVNAPQGALAAYQFYGRPFVLSERIRRIEPVINATDRVTARLEESRLAIIHRLTLSVEKAGLYNLDLIPQSGLVVADVTGDGIESWAVRDGKIRLAFASRVLGKRELNIHLEQALKEVPESLIIQPLRVAGAEREYAQIGVGAVAGIQLKAQLDQMTGLRELPIGQLPQRADESLAFAADQGDWKLVVAASRQDARVTAEIFNLATIGDGLVGGSATIRYAIVNQGVQELRVAIPSFWKNVDFTGPIIRRKEESKSDTGNIWTITLQEKAWGGYTLVVTYDYQFDPQEATLPIAGIHALDVERETGSIAITSTANQQLTVGTAADPLRRIDEYELTAADRALIARPVLIAYRYAGTAYTLSVDVKRFDETAGLQAVADRIQLTTVLTKEGDMMTQASFMVKNNDKQFQRITLPNGATLWNCFVNNQAVKPEQDSGAVLVPLPRGLNRDQSFAVDIVYAQKRAALAAIKPGAIALEAARTDMQTTYAEWEFYAPQEYRLMWFGGNMFAARGTTNGLQDAWRQFIRFYSALGEGPILAAIFLMALAALVIISIVVGIRRGFRGLITFSVGLTVLVVLAGMLLPALNTAREWPATANMAPSVANNANLNYNQMVAINGAQDPQPAGLPDAPAISIAGTMTPLATGIRPIRIDIPRQGNRYLFTKVLNVRSASGDARGELLNIHATAMKGSAYNAARSAIQVTAFLIGIALLIWQLKVAQIARRRSFLVTLGLVMSIGAVVSLLIAAKLLHLLFVIIPPIAVLAGFVWGTIRLWKSLPRKQATDDTNHVADATGHSPGVPPAVAGILAILMAATAAQAAPEPTAVPITSASYTGTVDDRAGQFEAVIQLQATEANQQVRLFGEEVAVQEFSAQQQTGGGLFGRGRKTSEARLVRDGKFVNVLLPTKGSATVRLKFVVKVTGDVAKRQVAFAIPAALSSRFNVVLDEPEAAVEFPAAISFMAKNEGERTRVEGVIGSGTAIDLTWTPRVKRAAEISATVFAQNTSLASIGGGVMNIRAVLDYQVMQGELRQLRVLLPSNHRLMRVEGELIRTWNIADEEGKLTLVVELLKGISPSYRLTVETEKMIGTTAASIQSTIEIPHALDVKRETGLIALKPSDDLAISVEKAEGLQKVDTEEFARALGGAKRSAVPPLVISGAYRFFAADVRLDVRIEAVKPEIEAVVNNTIRISSDHARITGMVNYTIKRAGVFVLQLALPKDYRVAAVKGDNISQWVEKTEKSVRMLEVTLKERTMGSYVLHAQLVRYWKEPPALFTVEGIHPAGTQKLTGYVSLSSEEGMELKSTSMTGLTEVPAGTGAMGTSIDHSGSVLTYRFITPEPKPEPSWTLSVETEQLESWVRAEIVNWLTLTESLLSGRSVIRYDIQNAPIKELRLRIPESLAHVDMTGPNIRHTEHEGTEWRVELENKIRGTYLLTVTWDTAVLVGINEQNLPLTGITAGGVERETGYIAMTAQAPIKVGEHKVSTGVLKMDTRETPEWAGKPSEIPTLVYRYLRPGYELSLATRRFEEAAVLQAIIDEARLTTVVAEDGQMMTEMSLAIRNNARQYLAVTLPGNTEVWSAFVAGQPVHPSLRGGKVLVPLERSGSDGAPIAVELIYVGQMPFPQTSAAVRLISPQVDLPLKNATWDLYLPPDYRYTDFKGTMTQQSFGMPAVESYSYVAYQQAEEQNKQVSVANVRMNVGQLRSSLETGKLKEASEYYNRAKRQAAANVWDETSKKDLQQLEQKWRRDQAGNLMQESQDNYQRNAPAVPDQADKTAGQSFAYDIKSAEEQVSKLQKAQEIAEAQVTPLRVNLPRRGLHYTFAQALQTETDKALEVTFDAANTRATSWPTTIGMGTAGFLVLWGIVAMMLRKK